MHGGDGLLEGMRVAFWTRGFGAMIPSIALHACVQRALLSVHGGKWNRRDGFSSGDNDYALIMTSDADET